MSTMQFTGPVFSCEKVNGQNQFYCTASRSVGLALAWVYEILKVHS